MWQKFPETMLAKATTTLALRRGFSDVIAGIASADEMDQAGLAAAEALGQGTPEAAPAAAAESPTSASKRKPQPQQKPQPQAPAAEAAAEQLAKATGGTVVEQPASPTADDLKAVGLELGLTTHAIEGILGLIQGDIVKGIATMQAKSQAEITKLNQKFAPAPVTEDW
jgi:hypothetical protein